jgi:hypothetical protein
MPRRMLMSAPENPENSTRTSTSFADGVEISPSITVTLDSSPNSVMIAFLMVGMLWSAETKLCAVTESHHSKVLSFCFAVKWPNKSGKSSSRNPRPSHPSANATGRRSVNANDRWYYFIILMNISSLTSTRIASILRAFGEQSHVIIEAGTSTALSAD